MSEDFIRLLDSDVKDEAYDCHFDHRQCSSKSRIFSRQSVMLLVALVSLLALTSGTLAYKALVSPIHQADLTMSANDGASDTKPWTFNPLRDEKNYGMTNEQCDLAFPGLFDEIGQSIEFYQSQDNGRISRQYLDAQDWQPGSTHVIIYNKELFINSITGLDFTGGRMQASLNSLNRALAAAPEPLPNVEFVAHDGDAVTPGLPYFAYTRRVGERSTWLMHDFGFYTWLPYIGTYQEVRRRARAIDDRQKSLRDKIPKLLWRGNVHMGETLRKELLRASVNKTWSDVGDLQWGDSTSFAENHVEMEDHCKWAFVAHTEGNTYSGRLKYLQNCRSLIFIHKLDWVQPFQQLLVSSGPHQNYVELERDFSDLDEKMTYYLAHMDEAQRIADNSVRTFRDRYVTPAATACYWRRLIRGWAEISEPAELLEADGKLRGAAWENVEFMRKLHWL